VLLYKLGQLEAKIEETGEWCKGISITFVLWLIYARQTETTVWS